MPDMMLSEFVKNEREFVDQWEEKIKEEEVKGRDMGGVKILLTINHFTLARTQSILNSKED